MENRFKFRIWNTNLKQMYYFNDTSLLKFKKNSWYLTFGNDIVASSLDGDIIMQCTGLKDNNGNEIFEGDIILLNGRNALIKWENGSFGYEWKEKLHIFKSFYQFDKYINLNILNCEVIKGKANE